MEGKQTKNRWFLRYLGRLFAALSAFFLIIILSIFFIAASQSGNDLVISDNSIFHLKLNKSLLERETEDPFPSIFIGNDESLGLIEIRKTLEYAAKDTKIKALFIEFGNMGAGLASLQEIRTALIEFKKSGKKIYTYSEFYTKGSYYLASVADKIVMPSCGLVEFNGFSSELLFFKGTLDKLGIKTQVYKVGNFKSAVEPFLLEKMSDYNRKQIAELQTSIENTFLEDISNSRKITKLKLKNISDSLLVRDAKTALKYNLITTIGYLDELEQIISTDLKGVKYNYVSYNRILAQLTDDNATNSSANEIAVVIAAGDIESGKSKDEERIGSESIIEQFKKIRNNDKIKAVVLRINSPGGSALASDVMWREIKLCSEKKPVFASMSDVAASGGYYMAMACDQIVVQPGTITGSIGVFGLSFNGQDFLKNKLGITVDREKTGLYSDLGSVTRDATASEKMIIQQGVNQIYYDFVSKAAKGRDMTYDELESVASGRVWSGVQAIENGLADTLGGLDLAIKWAAESVKIKDYSIKYFPDKKDFFEEIKSKLDKETSLDSKIKSELGEMYPYYKYLNTIKSKAGVRAEMPFKIKFF